MAQPLTTPKTETQIINSVEITSITVDYENNHTIVRYNLLLDDGKYYDSGKFVEDGSDALNPTAVYARLITHIETVL